MTNGYRIRLSGLYIRTSTMDSFPKDTHKYAFAMVKAARSMPIDAAEKLEHIKQLRFNVQLKELRKRINRRIT
jgi:hypothetical protein